MVKMGEQRGLLKCANNGLPDDWNTEMVLSHLLLSPVIHFSLSVANWNSSNIDV